MSAYDYHLITDLVAEFRDALGAERKAEARAAQMRGPD